MKTDINEMRQIINVYKDLLKISKRVSNLDVADCNVGLTDRQTKREDKLIAEAETIAARLGLHIYHQGDPRGASLYLVKNINADSSNYTDGVCIY
jgi:hypothetical protein